MRITCISACNIYLSFFSDFRAPLLCIICKKNLCNIPVIYHIILSCLRDQFYLLKALFF